jgi:hypothetical protein
MNLLVILLATLTLGTVAGMGALVIVALRRLPVAEIPKALLPNAIHPAAAAIAAVEASVKLPADVLDYTLGESEAWAQEDRQKHAAELFVTHGDWQRVLQELHKEDGDVT